MDKEVRGIRRTGQEFLHGGGKLLLKEIRNSFEYLVGANKQLDLCAVVFAMPVDFCLAGEQPLVFMTAGGGRSFTSIN